MLSRVSIAAPSLFKVARQLSHVEVVGQASHGRHRLTSITLLKVQMHEVVASGGLLGIALVISRLLVAINGVLAAKNELFILVGVALVIVADLLGGLHLLLVFGCHL